MKQYLLSVHNVEGEDPPPEETMQTTYAQVETFNQQFQASGAWVFAGGLHPPDTATVVRVQDGGDVITTDGPFAETEGAARRVLDHHRSRPRRRAWSGRPRPPRPAWLRSRCARSRTSPRPERGRAGLRRLASSNGSSGRSPVAASPRWSASSATSTSPRRRSRRRSWWPPSAGRPPACRRTPGPGSPPPPATEPSTASDAKPPAMIAVPRPRSSTSATNPQSRWVP